MFEIFIKITPTHASSDNHRGAKKLNFFTEKVIISYHRLRNDVKMTKNSKNRSKNLKNRQNLMISEALWRGERPSPQYRSLTVTPPPRMQSETRIFQTHPRK